MRAVVLAVLTVLTVFMMTTVCASLPSPRISSVARAVKSTDTLLNIRGGANLGPITPEMGLTFYNVVAAIYVVQLVFNKQTNFIERLTGNKNPDDLAAQLMREVGLHHGLSVLVTNYFKSTLGVANVLRAQIPAMITYVITTLYGIKNGLYKTWEGVFVCGFFAAFCAILSSS